MLKKFIDTSQSLKVAETLNQRTLRKVSSRVNIKITITLNYYPKD